MKGETLGNPIVGALLVGVVALVIWSQAFAPCGVYRWSAAADVPARCIGYFTGGQK